MEIQSVVQQIVEAKREEGGVKKLFFAACGGSLGAFYPAHMLIQRCAADMRSFWMNSNELVHSTPAALDSGAVLVVASHFGNTPETIQAAKLARERGATVMGLTHQPDSDLPQHCDYVLGYTYGESKDIAGEKPMVALKIAVELLQQVEGYAHYDAFCDGVAKINRIVQNAKAQVAKRAERFAEEYKTDRFIYTIGSGASWSSAYMESICILMEMQWINSACIHSGEYFHGPFEVTDASTPFILQISEGSTRQLDERARTFLQQYGHRYEVVDAKELGLSVIDETVVDYFNHSLFNNVYEVYNKKLSEARQHPLSTRRYMWKVKY